MAKKQKKNYQDVLDFMFNSLPMYQRIGAAAYKNDLSTSLKLDDYFGQPHKSYKTIHIAGTNGKGSVSHGLASILQEAGYKVGLYTSPHLLDYRERIRVNGEMISEEFVCEFINQNIKIIEDLKPSFFEMTSEMAFLYFKFMAVDIAIIEVGMGGRLDSTNVITPIMSVITNISYDHTQFLGDTIEKIAKEKAGIIKYRVPVIFSESQAEAKDSLIRAANNKKSNFIFVEDLMYSTYNQQTKEYILWKRNAGAEIVSEKDERVDAIKYELIGEYQKKNICVILAVISNLNQMKLVCVSKEEFHSGLENVCKNTGIRGRWEIISDKPLTICDIGHNEAGLKYNIEQLKNLEKKMQHFIIGFVNDKDVSNILDLFPKEAEYYLTQSSIPRAMPVENLFEIAKTKGLNCKCFPNVKTAYIIAKEKAKNNDLIYIGGSTFIVADFLTLTQI